LPKWPRHKLGATSPAAGGGGLAKQGQRKPTLADAHTHQIYKKG